MSGDVTKHGAPEIAPARSGGAGQARNKTLDDLMVISKLQVGPVRMEKARLVTPYRVLQNETLDSFDLIYRYEEDVFDPREYASRNLAAVIGAQVALNYGLFCREIEFHGPFDAADRNFLDEMLQNTACEIYVKKFLEPNPFLESGFRDMPVIVRDMYSQAALTFVTNPGDEGSIENWRWDPSRHVILSSGGKDSLLTFGLLRELEREVHPIFVNESGRHWFTALKAYRHFAANVPNTARVWTNSDRVFAWMLRHFPFIRSDFSQVRSDEYPIRLWTVAVFLFGALPLLRKRGIGRLLIGDEYDTTEKTTYRGITHYDGLYDQSRYFDEALTGYFLRKKWDLNQFSLLRPLSELLIEKILAERYPDLQRFQMSCHATHTHGDNVLPCGKCEKCRRIVGMLLAVGGDPSRCGYTPAQIQDCLRDIEGKGVHQFKEDAEHLAHLLKARGLISSGTLGSVRKRQRPNTMKLRFDPERSPVETIPVDLREPLYRIYLDHAHGAVRRSGRLWAEFDPLDDASLGRPYPFAGTRAVAAGERPVPSKPGGAARPFVLGELTWPEAQARFKEVDVALLPVGSIEQHGPHLPLDTDAYDAEYLALRVAEACSDPKPLVLPLMPYGVAYHHADFSGTMSVSPETLSRLVHEVGMSAAKHGITKLVIINGHGGNGPALHLAAQLINRDAHIFTCVDTGESSDADIALMIETPNDVHAGETETSTSLATRPELVRLAEARTFVPRFSSRYLDFYSRRSVGWYAHTRRLSPEGVLGDPTKASGEKGKRIWDKMVQNLVELVEDLKSMRLAEIYQKRY